jgi:hypothetical protein
MIGRGHYLFQIGAAALGTLQDVGISSHVDYEFIDSAAIRA